MTTLRSDDDDRGARMPKPVVSAEMARWMMGVGLAAFVSYFSTTYGLQARIDALEARAKAGESTSNAVAEMTREVSVLNQRVAVLMAIMERVEARQRR